MASSTTFLTAEDFECMGKKRSRIVGTFALAHFSSPLSPSRKITSQVLGWEHLWQLQGLNLANRCPHTILPEVASFIITTMKEGWGKCIACFESFEAQELYRADCGDRWCQGCTRSLFELSTKDQSLFPPECCGKEFPIYEDVLGADLLARWKAKRVEHTTEDKTYCHVPTCSAFIVPATIVGNVATCPACHATTCAICKAQTHDGACQEDHQAQEVLQIAEQMGWKRCGACKALIELRGGCNQMSELPYARISNWFQLWSKQWLINVHDNLKPAAVDTNFVTSAARPGTPAPTRGLRC